MWHTAISRCIHTSNLVIPAAKPCEIQPGQGICGDFLCSRLKAKVKVTVTQFWYATHRHPMMYPHIQFGGPSCKRLRDTARTMYLWWFLCSRSTVKVKVTVTHFWHATHRHPTMYPHTQFGGPSCKSLRDTVRTRYLWWFLCSRSKVKVTVTQFWHVTHRHPTMYPHTQFGGPSCKSLRDMARTRYLWSFLC